MRLKTGFVYKIYQLYIYNFSNVDGVIYHFFNNRIFDNS